MPRLCRETIVKQLDTMTYLNFLAEPANNGCEFVAERLDFLGIWGEFDDDVVEVIEEISWFDATWWKGWLISLWAPEQLYFKFVVHMCIGFCCYLLGLLTRRSRLGDLMEQLQQERTKSTQIMQQLWSAMEENMIFKSDKEKSRIEINDVKRDLQLAISEKDAIQTKNWGLERNMKIIQSERDSLDGKINNLLTIHQMTASSSLNDSFGPAKIDTATNEDLRGMAVKFQELQKLVKALLRTHREEKATMIEAMTNASGV